MTRGFPPHQLFKTLDKDVMGVTAAIREPLLPKADIRLKYKYEVPEGTLWARNRADDSAEKKVRLAHVDQGFLADCFLQATIGALALQRPTVFTNMLKSRGDKVEVRLASGIERVTKKLPTKDGELVYAASGGNKVLWPAYVEKAVAQHLRGGYRKLNEGGIVAEAFETITGDKPKEVARPANIIDDLERQLREGHAVTISTPIANKGSKMYRALRHANLEPDHVYVVTGTSHKDGTEKLKLWNIWGFEQPHPISENQIRQNMAEVVTDSKSYWVTD